MIGALTKRLVAYRLLSPFVIKPNREMLLFAGIALAALGLRLWNWMGAPCITMRASTFITPG